MESIVVQQIRKLLKQRRISITSLSKEIGIPQSTLNRQLNVDNTISISTIESLLSYFSDVSAEWLLRGEGNMLKSSTPSSSSSPSNRELVIYIDENGFLKAK